MPHPDSYQQDTEIALLLRAGAVIDNKVVLDVGACRGGFIEAFQAAGYGPIYAFEPFPEHVKVLRDRFGLSREVIVFDIAVGEHDGRVRLRIAQDELGEDYDYYHSLVQFADTDQIRWTRGVDVNCRTLHSLVETRSIPPTFGILKIDTEGNDLAVLRGMGHLTGAIIMAEYWDDLPDSIGKCPYQLSELTALLQPLGYSNFVFVKRNDEFEVLQMNNATTFAGDWGNVVFFHDSVYPRIAPVVYDTVAVAQTSLLRKALHLKAASRDLPSRAEQPTSYGMEQAAPGRMQEPQLDDIVSGDLFLGQGWYPLESFGGETFRWVGNDADIIIAGSECAPKQLELHLEAGPALGSTHFLLQIRDDRGATIVEQPVEGRAIIVVPVDLGLLPGVVRLHVDGGGLPVPHDGRILNFRVFSIRGLET
jgi:FkbM family methyltransferase